MKVVQASGRRKNARARATLRPGSGVVRVNKQLLYSISPSFVRARIEEPLVLAGEHAKKVDITVLVSGGGITSGADAVRLAIGKVLSAYNSSLQKVFLDYDRTLLVADVRGKETHKPNRHGKARAKVQKSYR